jgi:hypothetical protein
LNAAVRSLGPQEGGGSEATNNNLGDNIKNASSLMNASTSSGAGIGLEDGSSALNPASPGIMSNKMMAERKAQMEVEEKSRQEEIRSMKTEIENLATTCKNFVFFF